MTLVRLSVAAGLGGALGAAARAVLTDLTPPSGIAWITLAINVVGSAVLAALPAVAVVRRSRWLPVFLGTGVLGGFTTMSAAVAVPLADRSPDLTLLYVGLTLGAALGAAALARRFTDAESRVTFEAREGDE